MRVNPKCRPCRGFLVITGFVSHGFRRGLRCGVPPGLLTTEHRKWRITVEQFQIDDQKAEAPEARHNVAQPVRAGNDGKGIPSTVGATHSSEAATHSQRFCEGAQTLKSVLLDLE